MNILIIEDDIFLANQIKKVFEKKIISNRIKILYSYESFLNELYIIESYDIILVDIILGDKNGKNGIDITNLLRSRSEIIPIIIISGFNNIYWIESGFNAGTSDYITKPFRLKELEIRVYKWFKIYLYSNKSNVSDVINYYGLTYNLKENLFYFNNKKIFLTKSNKYLLSIFLTNNEILLSEFFLVQKIWGDVEVLLNRNLRISIFRLKNSLNRYGIGDWIKNYRGEGYIFKR